MNIFKKLFGAIGSLLKRSVSIVKENVTEEQISKALAYVVEAEAKFLDNTKRREWVVMQLKGVGIPEWAARIAVEFALKIAKQEAAKLGKKISEL